MLNRSCRKPASLSGRTKCEVVAGKGIGNCDTVDWAALLVPEGNGYCQNEGLVAQAYLVRLGLGGSITTSSEQSS